MDTTLNEQRRLTKPDFGNRNFFSSMQAVLVEVETELQKATIEWIKCVDPASKEMKSQSEMPAADD